MKRPWNLINTPVYSLATYDGEKVNMNICTYISAVSMKPKQYVAAVYHETQSLKNIRKNKVVILQLLGKQHLALVNVLGKKSGVRYDKESYLRRKNLLDVWHQNIVLSDCAALLEMEAVWSKVAGDHTLYLFNVKRFQTNHSRVLMLDDIREANLISI